ncbi:MAG: hypothetical protein ABI811_22520, partial [Acidobacteriota bacterium]
MHPKDMYSKIQTLRKWISPVLLGLTFAACLFGQDAAAPAPPAAPTAAAPQTAPPDIAERLAKVEKAAVAA